jgi:hypothetical protein
MNLPDSKHKYITAMRQWWTYWPMMLSNLPSIAFWGCKIDTISEEKCVIAVPFRFTTKNPFKSIYFAALNGAAEISTGFLVQMYVAEYGSHSMLVTKFVASFYKKSDTKILFTCNQGIEVDTFFSNLQTTGNAGVLTLISQGHNVRGELVCQMEVTWSIKKRN